MKKLLLPAILAGLCSLLLYSVSFAQSTPTLTPTSTPSPNSQTITATAPISGVVGLVIQNVSTRNGPGPSFTEMGKTEVGSTVLVVGKNRNGYWYELGSGEWAPSSSISLLSFDPVSVVTPALTAKSPVTSTRAMIIDI